MKYSINVRKFIKFLISFGFYKIRQKGSHATFTNGVVTRVFTIEKMTHTYSQGHLKKLLKDFWLSENDLRNFLKIKI
jgi:predicted RNA binding protein YcfA (HicA-like mRNA interferase family)